MPWPFFTRSHGIGPGRLVLVAGPSGAGKDTLIIGARERCQSHTDVVFPKRVVTRTDTEWEQHDTLSDNDFDLAITKNAFAFWWNAHGLKYGIPISIDSDIRAGRTVVCNVSRAVISSVRSRYARTAYVLVTAPPEVLAQRITQRGRASDGAIPDRINRGSGSGAEPDYCIENIDHPEFAVQKLIDVIYERVVQIAI